MSALGRGGNRHTIEFLEIREQVRQRCHQGRPDYIEGTHPTQAELVADLAALGWRPVGSLHSHLVFQCVPSGIRMHDVHSGNFIRKKNGSPKPIDVFIECVALSPS